MVAGTKNPAANQVAAAPGKTQVRVHLTVPPSQPLDVQPVARASMPAPDQVGQKFCQVPTLAANWQPSVTLQAPIPGPGPSPQPAILPLAGPSTRVHPLAPQTTPALAAPPPGLS